MKSVRKAPVRVYCEDTSLLLKSIRTHKDHGKVKLIGGITYEVIGGDMFLNTKTNRLEKLVCLK